MCVKVNTNCVCVLFVEISWVLWSKCVVRSHMVVCSAWEESHKGGGENWSIALVIWSFIPQRTQALKWSFPFSVLPLSSLFFQSFPFRRISLILITLAFLVGVCAWKKESKFFIWHATLLGEKVTGREVKCAVGTVSVCVCVCVWDGGPLWHTGWVIFPVWKTNTWDERMESLVGGGQQLWPKYDSLDCYNRSNSLLDYPIISSI